MLSIKVEGGHRLEGEVKIEGAKNAALPILAACILADGTSELRGIPLLDDVQVMIRMLEALGASVTAASDAILVRSGPSDEYRCPSDLVCRMRASLLTMGPLLARRGRAVGALPGGCAIGARPIDLHLKGFTALGARVKMEHGMIDIRCDGRLTGARIYLDFPSVTATENIMMAATLARGTTYIENSAEEPEIIDLANFLNGMGARITGAGTHVIRVDGVDSMKGTSHVVIPDRIEAGTFMVAAAITGGEVKVNNVVPDHLKSVTAKLREMGVEVKVGDDETSVLVSKKRKRLKATNVKTMPYPGFPTDMQAQTMALLSLAKGTSRIVESVFENRFMHVAELNAMGANISVEGRGATVRGVEYLSGAEVKATDLRAGAALVLAGLAARGETTVLYAEHIKRGYLNFAGKLRSLGAVCWEEEAE
ncbi:MAG TPA: UDP-N-acetylglucosamine 1-carboxyvinyltransferase [Clostridia bacterium]|nr:UDP-N-acetylglucosamine 1-carboxyvinyltransferase [Clostridia bacterium]